MFELDQAIAEWRRQMAADGLKAPALLDELESHLQDDIERQVKAGIAVEPAFQAAVRQLGQPGALTNEFSKVGETNGVFAHIKYFLLTLIGVPNPILATNMITSSTIEPAWATYLKSGAFALPAVILWLFVAMFMYPKFNEIISLAQIQSDLHLPAIFRLGRDLTLLMTHYLSWFAGGFILAICALEWRFDKWPRYRRTTFGFGTFVLNSVVLIAITTMVVLSLVAAAMLENHAK
jgi:hypothetical protein